MVTAHPRWRRSCSRWPVRCPTPSCPCSPCRSSACVRAVRVQGPGRGRGRADPDLHRLPGRRGDVRGHRAGAARTRRTARSPSARCSPRPGRRTTSRAEGRRKLREFGIAPPRVGRATASGRSPAGADPDPGPGDRPRPLPALRVHRHRTAQPLLLHRVQGAAALSGRAVNPSTTSRSCDGSLPPAPGGRGRPAHRRLRGPDLHRARGAARGVPARRRASISPCAAPRTARRSGARTRSAPRHRHRTARDPRTLRVGVRLVEGGAFSTYALQGDHRRRRAGGDDPGRALHPRPGARAVRGDRRRQRHHPGAVDRGDTAGARAGGPVLSDPQRPHRRPRRCSWRRSPT